MADAEASGDTAVKLLLEPQADILASIRVLKLFKAGLTAIPGDALRQCEQLVQLDIGGNPLQSFPETVCQLPKLEILFASSVGMTSLPNLSSCARLRMLGVKDNSLCSLDGYSMPEGLEWLIAAGNQIAELPNIGRLSKVRKLMLSHNKLTCEGLAPVAGMESLEMIRAAANSLEAFPPALLRHPRLAWVAVGGNPFAEEALTRHLAEGPQSLDFSEVSLGDKLGSGAGATVHEGLWRSEKVAVKIWDSENFSDGTARTEWAANRVASQPGHPGLVAVLGTFEEPRRGMVLELLQGAKAAAGPPTFRTVTRDALPCHGGPGPTYSVTAVRRIAANVAAAGAYLHSKGLMHGDIYLHNTLVVLDGLKDASAVKDVRLSDFGASAAIDDPDLRRLEVRSFGWLVQDLLESHAEPQNEGEVATLELLKDIRKLCASSEPRELPSFEEIATQLG